MGKEVQNREPILQIKGLSKQFPGVKALDGMDLSLFPGEVHILAGENGAGKSTLVKCILGYLQPDEGEIILEGQAVRFSSPGDALAGGIAAVYQELSLVPWLDVAENIYFNREPVAGRTGILRSRKMHQDARVLLEGLGSGDINVRTPVCKLGIARQQMIEIAKTLSMDPRIIVLDEPTAALSEKETEVLFERIRQLKRKGLAVLYISHRMQEYQKIGDRVTVMRDGHLIGSGKIGEFSEKKLVGMMVGRDVDQVFARHFKEAGEETLKAVSLYDNKGKVRDCSLTVKRGEIVGLCGLVGAGRTELSRLLFGIDRIGRGTIYLHGKNVTGKGPGTLVNAGLGLLPEDRKSLGLALRATVGWNITSASLLRMFPDGLLRRRKEDQAARQYMKELGVSAPGVGTKAVSLSGGNQQKVVLAKWMCANTDVAIFDEPTRGIDVGAKMEIYRLMDDMVSEGRSILMISSELPELIGMCDRIYVMREGKINGQLTRDHFSEERLGQMMLSGPSGGMEE